MLAKTISNLNVGLHGNVAPFAKSMKAAIGPLKSFSGAIASAGGTLLKFTGIGAAVGGAFAAIGSIGKGFTLAADMEQATVAMETMLGSASAAKAVLSDLTKFAANTPFELPELVDSTKKLIAFGVAQKDLMPALERIGNIASGVGAPVNELAELYGKAKTQGRLFAQDINQLTGRGIPIIQELAKQFGVSQGEVKGLVESGAIGFPQLEKAFASMGGEGGRFGGLMAKQSQTLSGLFSTMKDTIGMTLMDMANTIIKTFNLKDVMKNSITTFGTIGSTITGFIGRVAPMIKGLASMIGAAFAAIYGFVAPTVTKIVNVIRDNWQQTLTSTIKAFMGVKDFITGVLSVVGDIVSAVWSGIVTAWNWGTSIITGETMKTGSSVTGIFQGIVKAGNWMKDTIGLALTTIGFALENWRTVVDIVFSKALLGIVTFANQTVYFFTDVIPGVATWFANNWRDIFTTVANFTATVFSNIANNIVKVISNIPGLISGSVSFSDLWTPLTDGFESSIKEMPAIAEREVGAFEASLSQQVTDLENKFGDGLAAKIMGNAGDAAATADGINKAINTITGKDIPTPTVEQPTDPLKFDAEITDPDQVLTITPELKAPKAIIAGSAESQMLRFLRPEVLAATAKPGAAGAAGMPAPKMPTAGGGSAPGAAANKAMEDFWNQQLVEVRESNAQLKKIETNTRNLEGGGAVTIIEVDF
jgi:tape measure domain-containing protein